MSAVLYKLLIADTHRQESCSKRYDKVWPTNPSVKQADFYINLRRTSVLKLAKNASFMLFLAICPMVLSLWYER